MAFTNNFDNTFPPDTQLANQLGADIRSFKIDIQERMAKISGLDAAKPNLATDIQPVAWAGLLYFAIDTAKIYQWSGTEWVEKTGSIISQFSLSGLFADRPATSNTGWTYLATDTSKMYRWNGAAWAEITFYGGGNGVTLPGGIKLRWGNTGVGNGSVVAFDTPFPNNAFIVTATEHNGVAGAQFVSTADLGLAGFTVYLTTHIDTPSPGPVGINWLAIGN